MVKLERAICLQPSDIVSEVIERDSALAYAAIGADEQGVLPHRFEGNDL